MKAFTHAMKSLGHLDAEAVGTLLSAAADLTLVIDDTGVIRDMSVHSETLAGELGPDAWRGQLWADIVSPDSRPKIAALLREATATRASRWRHVNHPLGADAQLPLSYAAIRLGDQGDTLAFGRDLRAVSELQQRLVDAQQTLEEDYARLRHAETRARLLFQTAAEPVLILDAATLKVTEANPAAQALFGEAGRRLVGRGIGPAVEALADRAAAEAVQALLQAVRASGRPDSAPIRLAGQQAAALSATLFREGQATLLLLRIAGEPAPAALAPAGHPFAELMQAVPDGFVVIGADGRILAANPAFLDLAQLAGEDQARGEHLERWLGREGLNVDVLIANLRQRGTVRLFATVMRGEHGAATDVEISGAAISAGGRPGYGLAIRNVARRPAAAQPGLPQHTADQLTELIGRVPLKELVRRSTDVIERLCIETALKLTDDNRAAAAETLGLSRQSFYVKLRRYGLGDLGADDGEPA